jgi:amino acid adenylation domain-containing protein
MQTLTVDDCPGDSCTVTEQICQLGDTSSDSIALRQDDRQFTYTDLIRNADRFAAYLVQCGVPPGGTVALCMERSFDWIVAALGIMTAGAAYVPLDMSWPDSRVRYAVKDSGASALVCRASHFSRLEIGIQGIDPCRDSAAIAAAPKTARRVIHPEDLAYVIYTSGSSGVPKGVEITHANLAHLSSWHRKAFKIEQRDRVSHLAGLGFDAAVWEIWPNLCAGACVCLADDAARSSPELIQRWIIREGITVSFVPTVHAGPLMSALWPEETRLRLLLTGGDTLTQAPAKQLPFEVVNNYGPTECTVVSTSSVIQPGSDGPPPIGRAIDGASVYLLNEQGEPVPDGTHGEIYIGGAGVGRGYRNLNELTAAYFLPDPFSVESGARMFRTGDRGVRLPDGQIQFQGRLDRQIKIRGQRVELDEIGAVLSQHPSVQFATANIWVSATGEKQLAGYILLKENANVPASDELQVQLLQSLPDYMVPAFFVRLQEIPVSHNGKIDLKALPLPTDKNLLQRIGKSGPGTPVEEKLLTIMREILKNDEVGVQDNFFLAGGHSLLGMQLLLRLEEEFEVDLTLQQIFESPTVSQLAVLIETIREQQRLAKIWAQLLGVKDVGPDDNFFEIGGNADLLVVLQQHIAAEFSDNITVADLFRNPTVRQQIELISRTKKRKPALQPGVVLVQPSKSQKKIFWVHYLHVDIAKTFGDELETIFVGLAPEDLALLGTKPTLQSVAACLVRKIRETQSTGPYMLGGLCLGGLLAYEMAVQLRTASQGVSLLVMVDTPTPSYLKLRYMTSARLSQPFYLMKRLARHGFRKSLVLLGKRLRELTNTEKKVPETEKEIAHELVVDAANNAYQPVKYEGEVLLIVAAHHAPHVDFISGWQAFVPSHLLHTHLLNAHHRELIEARHLQAAAEIILAQLRPQARESTSLEPNAVL